MLSLTPGGEEATPGVFLFMADEKEGRGEDRYTELTGGGGESLGSWAQTHRLCNGDASRLSLG